MHIVFICTGNTCRSPMAQGLFQKLLAERGIDSITCDSAGLFAAEGEPAALNAVIAAEELGADLSQHRSKTLPPELLQTTDLFVVMMPNHAGVLKSAGVPEERIRVLGGGIGDPYGGDIELYRASRDQIYNALQDLLRDLGY